MQQLRAVFLKGQWLGLRYGTQHTMQSYVNTYKKLLPSLLLLMKLQQQHPEKIRKSQLRESTPLQIRYPKIQLIQSQKSEAILFQWKYKMRFQNNAQWCRSSSLRKNQILIYNSGQQNYVQGPYKISSKEGPRWVGVPLPDYDIGKPKETRRQLLINVVPSLLLHGAPVWANTLRYAKSREKVLFKVRRTAAIRKICAYSTVSYTMSSILSPLFHRQIYLRSNGRSSML